ncbi:MAG: formylglycine-generating enzyme family protein, partial [Polyangiales bacterium]
MAACCASSGCNAIVGLDGYSFPAPDVFDCGAKHEDCATSLLVTGGTFSRSFDRDTFTDPKFTARVDNFRLDKFEVTVGRFRLFLNDVVNGVFILHPGDGRHSYLNDKNGLQTLTGFESGWPADAPALRTSRAEWNVNLTSCQVHTWAQDSLLNEKLPINCITWLEAQAFCIWSGGFLPSEAEWNFAAAGGADQRVFPWPNELKLGLDTTLANFGCLRNSVGAADGGLGTCGPTGVMNIAPVGTSEAGNGKFGQADLAGNLAEWTLDLFVDPYQLPCSNCTVANT